jgi:putative hydrolase of the HAD superfamily
VSTLRAAGLDREGPPRPAHPKAILLDVGDTLVRADPSWRDVYARVFADHGIEATAEAFGEAFRAAWKDWENEGPFEATEEASFERLMALDRLVFERLGYPALPESFFRQVDEEFRKRSAFFVFPDVIPALDALRAAGFRLAVVSNWGWAAPELLQALELASHFEVLSISARVGYQKPHPAIFEHALQLLDLPAGDVVHVGDDPSADILGARRAGIAGILIDRRGRLDTPLGAGAVVDGVPVVRDLADLLDLLGVQRPGQLSGTGH